METLPSTIGNNSYIHQYLQQDEEHPNPTERETLPLIPLEDNELSHAVKTNMRMVATSVYLPKDNNDSPLGEDSHFIYLERQTFGVADGVGGWRRIGIDAGEYARELMSNCLISLYHNKHQPVVPKEVLKQAYDNTKALGSSTACLITLQGQTLRAVNVGDSGFVVIRRGEFVYKSPTQQSRFNCPYQLGATADNPSVAEELEVEVEIGDLIVAGTDGLFDNVFLEEIEDIIRQGMGNEPEELALLIANVALQNSYDKYSPTPFSMCASNEGLEYIGGKVDDITVIVAFIKKSE